MDVLKGNFKAKKSVEVETDKPESIEERFEREALKRLGGSMAFVKKRQVEWDLDAKKDGKK